MSMILDFFLFDSQCRFDSVVNDYPFIVISITQQRNSIFMYFGYHQGCIKEKKACNSLRSKIKWEGLDAKYSLIEGNTNS